MQDEPKHDPVKAPELTREHLLGALRGTRDEARLAMDELEFWYKIELEEMGVVNVRLRGTSVKMWDKNWDPIGEQQVEIKVYKEL